MSLPTSSIPDVPTPDWTALLRQSERGGTSTSYGGQVYRSRLEAQVQKRFDSLKIEAVYEPRAYPVNPLGGVLYLMDFFLPACTSIVEVKPSLAVATDDGLEKIEAFAEQAMATWGYPLFLLTKWRSPLDRDFLQAHLVPGRGQRQVTAAFVQCPNPTCRTSQIAVLDATALRCCGAVLTDAFWTGGQRTAGRPGGRGNWRKCVVLPVVGDGEPRFDVLYGDDAA